MDYLLPNEYVNTMKVLHDKAPESTKQEILTVIEEDLGVEVGVFTRSYYNTRH